MKSCSGVELDLRRRSITISLVSLVWLITIGAGYCYADPVDSLPGFEFERAHLEDGPEPTEVHERFVTITDEFFEPSADSQEVLRDVIPRALTSAKVMLEKAARFEYGFGWKALETRIDENETVVPFPDGKGELNSIDGVYFPRIVDTESKVSIAFLDEDRIDPDSPHLRQYIARQHIDAGDKGKWGGKPGRDLVIVWLRDGKVTRSEYLPRYFPGSPAWIADYWHATYKKAEGPDRMFGLYCGGLQVAAASCLALGKYWTNPADGFDGAPILFSALFGYGIAAWNSMYQNWIYRGNSLSQMAKLWAVSYAFAYSVVGYKDGVAWIIHFDDPKALLTHAHIFWNTFLHNLGRKAWYGVPQLMKTFRKASFAGTKAITLFGKTYDTGIKTMSWEQQKYYLIPYSLKLVGLVGLGYQISLPFINRPITLWGYDVPIPLISKPIDLGTLLLIGSIPIAHSIVVHFAEELNHPKAPEMRARWETLKRSPITIPKSIFSFAYRQLVKVGRLTGRACSNLIAAGGQSERTGSEGVPEPAIPAINE